MLFYGVITIGVEARIYDIEYQLWKVSRNPCPGSCCSKIAFVRCYGILSDEWPVGKTDSLLASLRTLSG